MRWYPKSEKIRLLTIRTGPRLFVICWESNNRRGIGLWPRLSFHIPQANVLRLVTESLFERIENRSVCFTNFKQSNLSDLFVIGQILFTGFAFFAFL
jgi:hypothetical protein